VAQTDRALQSTRNVHSVYIILSIIIKLNYFMNEPEQEITMKIVKKKVAFYILCVPDKYTKRNKLIAVCRCRWL
jgi:hypothetical protein